MPPLFRCLNYEVCRRYAVPPSHLCLECQAAAQKLDKSYAATLPEIEVEVYLKKKDVDRPNHKNGANK